MPSPRASSSCAAILENIFCWDSPLRGPSKFVRSDLLKRTDSVCVWGGWFTLLLVVVSLVRNFVDRRRVFGADGAQLHVACAAYFTCDWVASECVVVAAPAAKNASDQCEVFLSGTSRAIGSHLNVS